MKTAVYYSNSDIRIEEAPKPDIADDELLVRVAASGICGTDVVEWYRRDKVPLVLGHEIAGEIAAKGRLLKQYKIGERVAVSHHVPCLDCHYCRMDHNSVCDTLRKTKFYPGGFSEFLRVPAINIEKGGVYRIPDEVSFEEATFVEPLACAIRGQRLAGHKPGGTLLVIGSGISGMLHIQLAKTKSFDKIIATDIDDYRLKKALSFGADHVLNAKENVPAKVRELNNNRLADLVILCASSSPAFDQAFKSVDKGGTILIFASAQEGYTYPLPINDFFWRNEVTITSSYAANPKEHQESLELIRAKKVKVKDMITHVFSLDDIQKGFDLVARPKESIKVIIKP